MSEEKSQRRDAPRPVDRHKRTVTRRAGSVSRSRGVPAAATALLSLLSRGQSSVNGTSPARRPICRSACDSIVSKLGLGGQLRCYRPPLAKRVRPPPCSLGRCGATTICPASPLEFCHCRHDAPLLSPVSPNPFSPFSNGPGPPEGISTDGREPARRGGRTGAGVAAAAVGRARKAVGGAVSVAGPHPLQVVVRWCGNEIAWPDRATMALRVSLFAAWRGRGAGEGGGGAAHARVRRQWRKRQKLADCHFPAY